MKIKFVQHAITTEQLLELANKYCDGYKGKMSDESYKEIYFRIADFLRFAETNLNAETKILIERSGNEQQPKTQSSVTAC